MKKILYLIVLCALPSLLEAQNGGNDRFKLPKTPRRYYTQQNHERLLRLDPQMARRRAFMEFGAQHTGLNELPREVNIPVVVHLLYKSGTDTRNLPKEAEVRQQLNISSRDFRQTTRVIKHEADTREKFAEKNGLDTKISFCLASKDPQGRNTTGVLNVPISTTVWSPDDRMKAATTGGSTAWDSEKYLNIWVVNFADTVSGYAQLPGGATATDGIVIDYKYFGKKSQAATDSFPYTEGTTLTHLLGSYLNLYELWSETRRCADDGVEDTPISNAPNVGCPTYKHLSTCTDNPVEMTMNYMDNTNDACQYMFTVGQKKRMSATLIEGGVRYKLVKSGETLCTNGNGNAAPIVQQLVAPKPPVPQQSPISYRIYPNPAQDNINFDISIEKSGTATLTVFNAQGSLQMSQKHQVSEGSQSFSINCSKWTTGLYFVHLTINDTVVTERVLINR